MKTTDPPVEVPELHLCLLETLPAGEQPRWERSGVLSILVHVAGFFLWLALPASFFIAPEPARPVLDFRKSVPLVAPRFEITQKEPNRGAVTKEIDLEGLRANLKMPAPPPTSSRPAPFHPALPQPSAPSAPPVLEAPKIQAEVQAPQPSALGTSPQLAAAPAPEQKSAETPKLVFETPGSPAGTQGQRGSSLARVPPPPKGTVEEAIRGVARQGSSGLVIGDLEEAPSFPAPGMTGGPTQKNGSSLELLSDPMGVDFRPYLIHVLAAVRRNWFAVIPESARLGRRGRVLIQFAIARDGKVPKLVIASPSGAEALDRAAVAGISASNPFPPLPGSFQGEQIRLQLSFTYNLAR